MSSSHGMSVSFFSPSLLAHALAVINGSQALKLGCYQFFCAANPKIAVRGHFTCFSTMQKQAIKNFTAQQTIQFLCHNVDISAKRNRTWIECTIKKVIDLVENLMPAAVQILINHLVIHLSWQMETRLMCFLPQPLIYTFMQLDRIIPVPPVCHFALPVTVQSLSPFVLMGVWWMSCGAINMASLTVPLSFSSISLSIRPLSHPLKHSSN